MGVDNKNKMLSKFLQNINKCGRWRGFRLSKHSSCYSFRDLRVHADGQTYG